METSNRGRAAEQYASFIGKNVIIYYRDMKDVDRKLYGEITNAKGDILFMQNGEWRGILNCANARVTLVSTVDGWGSNLETKGITQRTLDK